MKETRNRADDEGVVVTHTTRRIPPQRRRRRHRHRYRVPPRTTEAAGSGEAKNQPGAAERRRVELLKSVTPELPSSFIDYRFFFLLVPVFHFFSLRYGYNNNSTPEGGIKYEAPEGDRAIRQVKNPNSTDLYFLSGRWKKARNERE